MNGRKNRTPGSIGGEKLTRLAVSAALLTLAACGGGGDGTDTLASANAAFEKTNVAEVATGGELVYSITQDDNVAADAPLQIVGQPANGTAVLSADGEVQYTANAGFEGTDTIDYMFTDADGEQSTGRLYVAVVCADCAAPVLAAANAAGMPYCVGANADPDGDGYGWEDNASCAAEPAFAAAMGPLAANADTLDINAGEIRTISPLINDSIANRASVQFSIDAQPTAGNIIAAESGVIVYEAPRNFTGMDSMMYSISDASGATSVASIDVNVQCDSCTDHKGLRLSWPANPEAEGIDGYRIMFGSDDNPLTSSVISDVQLASLNGQSPSVTFDLEADLNVTGVEGGCFMIKAYRGAEESEPSEAACFTRG